MMHPFASRHIQRLRGHAARLAILALLGFGVVEIAAARTGTNSGRSIDPRALADGIAGQPARILVLGTDHLSHMPANYRSEYLEPLLQRLMRYQPNVITIEQLSGAECEYLRRYQATVPGVADDYCSDTTAAAKATGLTVPQATAAVREVLAGWPAAPTAAQRRHLAALFLASNDRSSAAVQWLRLPPGERREGDGIDAVLLALLRKEIVSPNENIAIAATLAARLGLERVYPVDEHASNEVIATLGSDYNRTMQAIWTAPSPLRGEFDRREHALDGGVAVLSFYRWINDPAVTSEFVQLDMGAALRSSTPQIYGRQYVGWWETRNLRMVANIRQAYANQPGARVLSIVGASHKPYFEAYLGMMSDAKVVDTSEVLGRD